MSGYERFASRINSDVSPHYRRSLVKPESEMQDLLSLKVTSLPSLVAIPEVVGFSVKTGRVATRSSPWNSESAASVLCCGRRQAG
jgi:hypothetical protein